MFVGGHLAQAQTSQSRTVTPFTKIDATDGVEIVLNPNGPPSVAVFSENTDELINLITEIKGTTLKIKKLKYNQMFNNQYFLFLLKVVLECLEVKLVMKKMPIKVN